MLGIDGKPLTPTTPTKARKLLEAKQAKKVWSKFGTFGIQMLVKTGAKTPLTVLGYDTGTKFEGISIVSGVENNLSVTLNLPDKQVVVDKVYRRKILRHARRRLHCRRRPVRCANRRRSGFYTPSQAMLIESRLKVLGEFLCLYPVSIVGNEDVHFNHAKYRWGSNFSTMEVGKAKIRQFFEKRAVKLVNFQGFETQTLRKKYEYQKTRDKAAKTFNAHCSDALALACEVGPGERVQPGRFLVVDDTYRPVRRRLHDSQFAPGGVRGNYSQGTVFGLRKGLLLGTLRGKEGQLCGKDRKRYRYYDNRGKRQSTTKLAWISNHFVTRGIKPQENVT